VHAIRLALLLFAVASSGCVGNGGSVETPVQTSVAAVVADPARYHGKYLRLRGFVDHCERLSCSIVEHAPDTAPRDPAANPALPIDFEIEPGRTAPIDDADFRDRSRPLMDELYRFAEVTVVGYYNATCQLGYDPDHPPRTVKKPNGSPAAGELESIVVCTDRAGSFKIQQVLAVYRRWPATAVPVAYPSSNGSLTPLSPSEGTDVFAAYKAAVSAVGPNYTVDWNPEHRAFRVKIDDDGWTVLCVCRIEKCEGRWPSSVDHLTSAPSNPYACTDTTRVRDAWRFPPAAFE
jgi:hypothetical protein